MRGKLLLIPAALSEHRPESQLPLATLEAIRTTRWFIAERAKTARRYIKLLGMPVSISELHVMELNKHGSDDVDALLQPCMEGHDVGLISEAGVPGVADPGEHIVRAAHSKGIDVVPLVGPSALLLAMMASGMNGQSFSFHGYLPRETAELTKRIKSLEAESRQNGVTQMFIETPYRNEKIWGTLLKSLAGATMLGIAQNLLADDQLVHTKRVEEWKKSSFMPSKQPAVFTIYSAF